MKSKSFHLISLWLSIVIVTLALLPTPVDATALSVQSHSAKRQIVFSDDFSTDPNTSGSWTIRRYSGDRKNECLWYKRGGFVYLTRAVLSKACAMFANNSDNTIYRLPAASWTASFDYKVGGGTQEGGDGFVFMFYKKSDYVPGKGGNLGFQHIQDTHIPGYGIEFDAWKNSYDPSPNHVALIIDGTDNHKCFVNTPLTEDSKWHRAVVVKFIKSSTAPTATITVSVNGQKVLTCKIQPKYTYRAVGFSAATEGATNNHIIDNFVLSVP